MKTFKRTLAIILAVAIIAVSNVIPVAAISTSFTDVKTASWYYVYVNKLIELKITSGIGNNKYGPDNSVTKAEFVTFLCKATAHAQEEGYIFTDTKTHWAKKYISAAVKANIIDQGTSFNPNKAITRQEAVEMLCRSLNLQEDTRMATPYTDVIKDAGYSNTAYKEYLMQGYIENNKRYFNPSSSITRAETASVIVNLVDYKANAESYKADKKAELAQQEQKANEAKAEAEKYQTWLSGMDKGVSTELLNNVTGLTGGKTLQECNEYTINTLKTKYTAWWSECNASNGDDFIKAFVTSARLFSDMYYNRDYRKLDVFEQGLRKYWAPVNVENYLQRPLKSTKDNTIVKQGQLLTGTSLLCMKNDSPVLRGTLKYRYLEPTNSSMYKTDICVDTKKPCELNTWYTVDVEVTFTPEDGLRVNSITEISSVRLWR